MQQPRTDTRYSWCQKLENCFFAIMKMKIFNLLLRATGDPGHATAKGRLPAGLLSAGLDWHTKRVYRIFKSWDESSTGIPLTVKSMVFLVLAPKSAFQICIS